MIRFRIAARVGRERCVATHIPEEWPSIPPKLARAKVEGQNPAYRPAGTALRTPGDVATKKAGLPPEKADIAADFAPVEHVLKKKLRDDQDLLQLVRFRAASLSIK